MSKLQLHFNGNFPLKKEEIRSIVQAADDEKGLNDSLQGLMDRTSLGNAKVGRIKSWASRAGLISNNHLSAEGEAIWRLDPYLESSITDWLIHFYLSLGDKRLQPLPERPADWGGWSYFVYSFVPHNSKFTFDELLYYCNSVFEEESQVIATRIKFILRAYTEPNALASCRFIRIKGKEITAGNASLPNPYLIGYFLAKLWHRDFQGEGSVLTGSIQNSKMGLASVLGVKSELLQEQLNTLEAYGIIEQRRAVPPFQVIPRWDEPLALLEKAYDSDR